MQLDPLPNTYYLAKKIRESYEFIDRNRNITLAELPQKWVNFWRVKDAEMLDNSPYFPPNEELYNHYSITTSHIIFAYIYSRYYRHNDFADPSIYSQMYVSFQKLLLLASAISKRFKIEHMSVVKLFDLKKIDHNVDWLTTAK